MMDVMREMKRGFTLLEMSIVLVVIGLIVGGIMSGQALLRNAERTAVVSEVAKYRQAFIQFTEQYSLPPGDFSGATELWGSAGGVSTTGAACFTVSNTTALTCDGNGNGRTNYNSGAVATDSWFYGERFHAWKHIVNAGLIEGRFTGVTANPSSVSGFVGGINVPASRMKNYGYTYTYAETASTYHYVRDANDYEFVGHVIMPYHRTGGAMIPRNLAKYVDEKLDDGLPGTGSVRGYKNCGTSSDRYTAKYDLAPVTDCTLIIYMPRADGSFY